MLLPGALPDILTDMPVSALVQQAELNQQDPSPMSLSSRPDVLGREVQVTRYSTQTHSKTPAYELPEAPYLTPAVYD